MTTSSTAILCIVINETPYLEEWLEHHIELGIDCIYLISTDKDYQSMMDFVASSKYKNNIKLYHYQDFKRGWQIRCYNSHFKNIEEDWLLILDSDEYLYLNAYKNIHDFLSLADHEVGQIQFPWLNLTTTEYTHNKTVDILNQPTGYASDHVKSMVRRKYLRGIGIHSHAIGKTKNLLSSGYETQQKNKHALFINDPSYYQHHPCILHFTSRGCLDVMVRIIGHQFFNAKNGAHEHSRLKRFLLNEANWKNLPNRFLLLKIHQSLPSVELNFKLPKLQSSINNESLFELFLHNIQKIVEFDSSSQTEIETVFEKKYQLQTKLESLTLDNCDTKEYLKYKSQLGYANKLRKQLC